MASMKHFYSRGAEAEIYLTNLLGLEVIVKKRVSKPYRHREFDKLFIETRTRTEARILAELYANGLRVPVVILVDIENGVIVMEYIDGVRVSDIFDKLPNKSIVEIGSSIGEFAAKMHSLNIYHGDFTLANVLLSNGNVAVIDFGLAGYSTDIEEYAMDLHLMNRSAHAIEPEKTKTFIKYMIEAYRENYKGDSSEVLKRMTEIKTRGRYISRELRKAVMKEKYIG